MSHATAEEALKKHEAEEKAALDKLAAESAERKKHIAELTEKEKAASEKEAAEKAAKEEAEAAKAAAEKAERIAANPTAAALAEVAKAFRGLDGSHAAYVNAANNLDACVDRLAAAKVHHHHATK